MKALGLLLPLLAASVLAASCGGGGPVGIPSTDSTATGKIAFSHGGSIYLIDADGTDLTGLSVDTPGEPLLVYWSPDGTQIAFVDFRDELDQDIYVINADGSRLTNLTDGAADYSDPAWSPDGKRIAFASDRDGKRDIYVANADGSGLTKLSHDSTLEFDSPVWSNDGERIVVEGSEEETEMDIYVMNADGSGLTNLSSDPSLDVDPAWSPDSGRIALARGTDLSSTNIHVMHADGSGLTRLTTGSPASFEPEWSPDGRRIAFLRGAREFLEVLGGFDLWVMNVDGSHQTLLFDERVICAAWSPDGRHIAFVHGRVVGAPLTLGEFEYDLSVIESDGSGQARIAEDVDITCPQWSPVQSG